MGTAAGLSARLFAVRRLLEQPPGASITNEWLFPGPGGRLLRL